MAAQPRCDAAQADAEAPRAAPDFVPIVSTGMPADAAAPAVLATPVIEVRLADAVVRVVFDLDDTQLTAVLRAVRASALRP